MFKKLRRRIIIITMAITTTVLVLAGAFIMLVSSVTRPEPKMHGVQENSMQDDMVGGVQNDMVGNGFNGSQSNDTGGAPSEMMNNANGMANPANNSEQEIRDYIKMDREEGHTRLLVSLLTVGISVEVVVFLVVLFASRKIVEPVENSYEKQKLFIANASHELKTPLAIIQANMEALEVDSGSEKWKDNIENEIDHANKLVLNLLQLARMDAGSIDKSRAEEVDLAGEIAKRVEMFAPKFAGKISFKNVEGLNSYSLPRQDVLQVLDILLDNATKYGDKKIGVVLTKNGFAVSNDGAVVPADECKKVFDRFYQTDKTKEGSGLGLAIAKALCQRNGWNIGCDSAKNKTTFVVRLV